ncbi:MAG TPA: CoA pyrophosphatase [Woeseiaceae bacterium]|nr:CoA pyrophosphatase [Woeseiaceae bacterium]
MTRPAEPTLALLRERLGGTHPAGDPVSVVLPPGSEAWPADLRDRLTSGLKPAGVLIPVIERDAGLVVLLTRRAAALRIHAGQVAFPGGGMAPGDGNIVETALRETREEVGIRPDDVAILGCLDAMPTITGYAVTAIVGNVSPAVRIVTDPAEVAFAFEVPLAFLMDAGNVHTSMREVHGRILPVVEFLYDGHRIWGATANMLLKLKEKLA